jgi:hypothetical protein
MAGAKGRLQKREEGCDANSEGDEGSVPWARLRAVGGSGDTAGILRTNTRLSAEARRESWENNEDEMTNNWKGPGTSETARPQAVILFTVITLSSTSITQFVRVI